MSFAPDCRNALRAPRDRSGIPPSRTIGQARQAPWTLTRNFTFDLPPSAAFARESSPDLQPPAPGANPSLCPDSPEQLVGASTIAPSSCRAGWSEGIRSSRLKFRSAPVSLQQLSCSSRAIRSRSADALPGGCGPDGELPHTTL